MTGSDSEPGRHPSGEVPAESNLINAYRLQQAGAELRTALASVGQFLTDLDHALAELRT